jgi:LysM repeat protein
MNKLNHLIIFLLLICLANDGHAKKHRFHVIKKGDSPALIAKKHHISVDELFRFNNMKPGGPFRAGTKLEIPFPGEVTGKKYTVKSGDSIAKIADFHGCSQDDLRAANGLHKTAGVRVGQKLSIPHSLRGGAYKGHVVRKGDTLGSISKKYKVSVKGLAAANKLSRTSALKLGRTLVIPDDEDTPSNYKPKKTDKLVKSGKKVSRGVLHTIQPGQSLWIIARAYNTSGQRVATANGFPTDGILSVGRRILIPGATEVVPVRVKGFSIQRINFISVWNNKSAKLKLISKSGKINQNSRKQLSRLAGPKRKTKHIKLFHPRMLHMIQRISERYPGHSIEIVSGYRPQTTPKESKHAQGRAIDFRVRGIDRKELYNFVKSFPNVGAGWYPNSVFIHLDVREKSTTWIDYSSPGEQPRYSKSEKKNTTSETTSEK